MNWKIHQGDCLAILPTLPADSIDSIVTDPPYGLGFMGKDWDRGVLGVEFWKAALRVAKPGAHLLAFSGTRTFHRLWCAIEDAGWEIRDTVAWVYGSGFPKSKNMDGNWSGWGTALKPAFEPICLARKPLAGTVAQNVQAHGTGGLNIDGCRVGEEKTGARDLGRLAHFSSRAGEMSADRRYAQNGGMADPNQPQLCRQSPAGQQPADEQNGRASGVALGDAERAGLEGYAGNGNVGDQPGRIDPEPVGPTTEASGASAWSDFRIVQCLDGKARRIGTGIQPLAHGVPARVVRLRGYGNAIVPQVAAGFVRAFMEIPAGRSGGGS